MTTRILKDGVRAALVKQLITALDDSQHNVITGNVDNTIVITAQDRFTPGSTEATTIVAQVSTTNAQPAYRRNFRSGKPLRY